MSLDPSQDFAAVPLVSPSSRGRPGPLMIAGVAGACVLGAGLGFLARPDGVEPPAGQRHHLSPPLATAPRRIQIRFDDGAPAAAPAASSPAPLPKAAPAQTPAAAAPPAAAPPAPAPAPVTELLAAKPAADGLTRVHVIAPAQLPALPTSPRQPAPPPAAPKPDPTLARRAAAARAKAQAAERALAARQAEAARVAAQAAADKRAAAQLEKARVAAAQARAKMRAERLAAARGAAEKAEKLEKARLIKAQAAARREAKLAARARAEAAARQAEAARQERAHTARAKAAPIRGGGLLRTASASQRCTSPDPGAALACADPALTAAERQLSRAYREAQAAGVPEAQLQHQQQRWLMARAAAARQAPWAVHDIYLARIAELQDQTRQAGAQGD